MPKYCITSMLIFFIVVCCVAFISQPHIQKQLENQTNKIAFWDNACRKGANIFNENICSSEDIQAAKEYGIEFVRLACDKFKANERDFLVGDCDNYSGINSEDVKILKMALVKFREAQLPVVITMLSLPGSRWRQNNNGKDDLKIWEDQKYVEQAAQFWKALALELKDDLNVIGYNILNEPHPERIFDKTSGHIEDIEQKKVQQLLHDFYAKIIACIREVDQHTPIILDSSAYADPNTFKNLVPHTDPNVIYSFHMYEPFEYTNKKQNNGKFRYPTVVSGTMWDRSSLATYMSAVETFLNKHKIPSSRMLVGEFGGHRSSPGLDQYFADLISVFEERGWHFAFYAFREDSWDGMDYELGDKPLPWTYWQAIEKGEKYTLARKSTHSAFSKIINSLAKQKKKK